MIGFNETPTNLRVPFVSSEFDSSKAVAGPSQQVFKHLVIGQKLAGGTGTALTPYKITSVARAIELFGAGSIIHKMVAAVLANDKLTELSAIAMADVGGGVAATGSFTFSGTATKAGTISLRIGGELYSVGVASGDDAADIATAVAAAITDDDNATVTAAVDGSVDEKVNLTFKHKGLVGNYLDVRFNYSEDEAFPEGVSASVVAMANGTTDPDVSTALAALGDAQYHIISHPYTGSSNLNAIDDELNSRFGPTRQNEGYAFTGSSVGHSSLVTLGESRNNAHHSIIPSYKVPQAPWVVAAAVAAVVARYASIDAARPFKTLPVIGVDVPEVKERFTMEERNLLLYAGISTLLPGADGQMRIERIISTYRKNGAGADDTAYLSANTHFTLSYIRYDWNNHVLRKFPRHKLASDLARVAPGQPIVTPNSMKAEVVSKFRDWEEKGYVEDGDQFKSDLIVEINASDKNRLDIYLSPNLINQFESSASQIGFLL